MSKKRGLSLEEKRSRMLEIFYEKKDFFLLKEMEKIAPKEKGIISQSVKDVLQSLVDDNLVDTDKIGTSVYFWAFPSKATAARKKQLSEMRPKLEEVDRKIGLVEQQIAAASGGREEGKDRDLALAELTELRNRKEKLRSELQMYRDCDPEVLEELRNEIKMSADGANRWTDNIYAMQSWIGKKFPSIDVRDLNKQFGIPEDLDYVE